MATLYHVGIYDRKGLLVGYDPFQTSDKAALRLRRDTLILQLRGTGCDTKMEIVNGTSEHEGLSRPQGMYTFQNTPETHNRIAEEQSKMSMAEICDLLRAAHYHGD